MTKRYSKENTDMIHTSISIRADIFKRVLKWKEKNRARNRSDAMEKLMEKGLEADANQDGGKQ